MFGKRGGSIKAISDTSSKQGEPQKGGAVHNRQQSNSDSIKVGGLDKSAGSSSLNLKIGTLQQQKSVGYKEMDLHYSKGQKLVSSESQQTAIESQVKTASLQSELQSVDPSKQRRQVN